MVWGGVVGSHESGDVTFAAPGRERRAAGFVCASRRRQVEEVRVVALVRCVEDV